MRRARVAAFLRTHWPKGTPDLDAPVHRAFLDRSARPRDQGDHTEQVLANGTVHLRYREEPWASFRDRRLFSALCAGNFDLPPETLAPLKEGLRRLAER